MTESAAFRPPEVAALTDWLLADGYALRDEERVALRNAVRHAASFEGLFKEMFGTGLPPAQVVAATESTITNAAPVDALSELKDAIVSLNGAVDRLSRSNGNGEALAKLNTVLQFLQVVLTILAMSSASSTPSPPAGPAVPTPTVTVTQSVTSPPAAPATGDEPENKPNKKAHPKGHG